jgi:hypothetical protein
MGFTWPAGHNRIKFGLLKALKQAILEELLSQKPHNKSIQQ